MTERHFWDTCCWIDFVDEGGDPKKPMTTMWGAVVSGHVELIVSPIIICETLLQIPGANRPWPDPHPSDDMFDTNGVTLAAITRRVGERARSLRRQHSIKTPDALHLACCIENSVDQLVTRDNGVLLKVPPLLRRDGDRLKVVTPAEALGGPLFGV